MIDQILSQEDQGLDALVSSVENGGHHQDQDDRASDYEQELSDELFLEVMSEQEVAEGQKAGAGSHVSPQNLEMHMSPG